MPEARPLQSDTFAALMQHLDVGESKKCAANCVAIVQPPGTGAYVVTMSPLGARLSHAFSQAKHGTTGPCNAH